MLLALLLAMVMAMVMVMATRLRPLSDPLLLPLRPSAQASRLTLRGLKARPRRWSTGCRPSWSPRGTGCGATSATA